MKRSYQPNLSPGRLITQVRLPWGGAVRLSPHAVASLQILPWNMQLPADKSERGNLDYFANLRYDPTTGTYRMSDTWSNTDLWQNYYPASNPPCLWVFCPLDALEFQFELYTQGGTTPVLSSGWQKAPVWIPQESPLANGNYFMKVRYRRLNGQIAVLNPDVYRFKIDNSIPVWSKPSASTILNTRATTTSSGVGGRRRFLGPQRDTLRTKVTNGNEKIVGALYTAMRNRFLGPTGTSGLFNTEWKIRAQNEQNNSLTGIRIFPGGGAPESNCIFRSDGYYGGHPDWAAIVWNMGLLWFLETDTAIRAELRQALHIYIQVLVEKVLQQGNEWAKTVDWRAGMDNASFSLTALVQVLDMMEYDGTDAFVNAPSLNVRGTSYPFAEGIVECVRRYIEEVWWDSPSHRFSSHPTLPYEARLVKPFESHMNRHWSALLLLLAYLPTSLSGYETKLRHALWWYYNNLFLWSFHDRGYTEGLSYLLAYWGEQSELVLVDRIFGLNLRSHPQIINSFYDLIYQSPYGMQDHMAGDASFTGPFNYDRYNWSVIGYLYGVAYLFQTDPRGRYLQYHASQASRWGTSLTDPWWLDGYKVFLIHLLYPSATTYLDDETVPSGSLNDLPPYQISRVTKIASLGDSVGNQRQDGQVGERHYPRIRVWFNGARLGRASHSRNTVNDVQIHVAGEWLVGGGVYGYAYSPNNRQHGEYAKSSIGYSTMLVCPSGDWEWNNTLVRDSQKRHNALNWTAAPLYYFVGTKGGYYCQYVEHDGAEAYTAAVVQQYRRRVLVVPEFPAVFLVDDVGLASGGSAEFLWAFHAAAHYRYGLVDYPTLSPVLPLGQGRYLVQSCRRRAIGSHAGVVSNPLYAGGSDPENWSVLPRIEAYFAFLPPSSTTWATRACSPFEDPLFKMPTWNFAGEFPSGDWQVVSGSENAPYVRTNYWYHAVKPYPIAIWSAASPSYDTQKPHQNHAPVNQSFSMGLAIVPYRLRYNNNDWAIGEGVPPDSYGALDLLRALNDWDSHRRETTTYIDLGVYSVMQQRGIVARFYKSYIPSGDGTVPNAFTVYPIHNNAEWQSFKANVPGSG